MLDRLRVEHNIEYWITYFFKNGTENIKVEHVLNFDILRKAFSYDLDLVFGKSTRLHKDSGKLSVLSISKEVLE